LKNKITGYLLYVAFILLPTYSYGQETDSIDLQEVTVTSYFNKRPYLRTPSSIAIIDSILLAKQEGGSLVQVLNTVPGVRMEERSPGSYRLSIRGSLLRSPFGVRNVKIYLDEFPLTNAGGNTYLNLLDPSVINRIEVIKGPDGSLFGANSGGVLRISPSNIHVDNTRISAGITAGSYGLFQQNASLQLPFAGNLISVSEALQSSDGYRVNSSLSRKYFQITDKWNYSSRGQLRLFFFYSDLNYLTPGGLTLSQWQENPRAARPPTKALPGSEQQNAGVLNKTFYGGILNEFKINDYLRHVIAVFGSNIAFENRFITNIEEHTENNFGVRTWIEAANHHEGLINLTFNLGGEMQTSQATIYNYGNRSGIKDTVQTADYLKIVQRFGFAHLSVDFYNKLTIEASASLNDNRFLFSGIEPIQTSEQKNVFKLQLMPRFVFSYLISENLSLRASISRGYSPPTIEEIRSSDNLVNTNLQPESGWNYETGFRCHDKHNQLWWDVSVFYYQLQNAIGRRTNDAGQEFFVNAGETKQPGIESLLTINLISPNDHRFLRELQLTNSFTDYNFKFSNYKDATTDYSGNHLTGVPKNVILTGMTMKMPLGFFISGQFNYTSRIPLNDANSVYADAYHVVDFKAGWVSAIHHALIYKVYLGINNLLNTNYSLGNDLNAVGARYYNSAPTRNFFAGVSIIFNKRSSSSLLE